MLSEEDKELELASEEEHGWDTCPKCGGEMDDYSEESSKCIRCGHIEHDGYEVMKLKDLLARLEEQIEC
jgi:hypothetical protein